MTKTANIHGTGEGNLTAVLPEWLPIETAPKMKTILLFAVTDIGENGTVQNWRMGTGAWHSGWENDDKYSPWEWGRQLYKYDIQPTHWMALPEPPRPEEERR